ncbi:unnamed protein product [Rotaria socialis]|uniref:Uncharacterized protein n=1 Tax=Rotaria socialis TaxID=392032 RepID=A0A820WUQ2_9BILA|nr:unnamed protein product [Rotaria socialis]CAF3502019.1 unnamed protein product [Rotaria socialis]CAF3529450.1 unnamed protein product [Rotaria socialis]CAF4102512.1 unnamed protein product [Rotaria socialis]CAF4109183.1 unnamed protein product [Rotaria socialis]
MIKNILLIIGIELLFILIDHCQALNNTDSTENITEIIQSKPFVYYGRYHQRRSRHDYSSNDVTSDINTIGKILSILPDGFGAIIGQIVAASLKEIVGPNVGNKILKILENQTPSLLTSLSTNILNSFRSPMRSSTGNTTRLINKSIPKSSNNSSISTFMNFIRRPRTK